MISEMAAEEKYLLGSSDMKLNMDKLLALSPVSMYPRTGEQAVSTCVTEMHHYTKHLI